MSNKRKHTGFTLKEEILDLVAQKADRENRSRSNVIENILREYFEEHPEIGLEKTDGG